jgi:tetratricopeptide (TPR) repeat protein
MSWATRRQTTVEEDTAYCLLGIFDIHMPLIYGEGRKKALVRLQKEFQQSSKPPSLISKDEAPWIVPFQRNLRFTGRESQLTKLGEKIFVRGQTTKVAIFGLGGIGKTQLVLELVYRVREKNKNCLVIWIPATNMESLHQAYIDTARQLSIPGWENGKTDVKRLVQEYLGKESAYQWLLVFDNADDINMWTANTGLEPGSSRLIEYLPKSNHGCIIFTTRDRKTAVKLSNQNVVDVPELDEEAAKQLLQTYLVHLDFTKFQPDTKALLAQLTYLPLAIVQAAAYINGNHITIADYLSLLANQEEEVIDLLSEEFEDDGRYHNVKNPVATTWLISFEQIRHRDPLAADYLSFMACIDPKDIPQSLLSAGASQKKEMDAIGTLDAYSFIIRRPTDLALDLHQLVHLATRNWLRKERLITQWTETAISRLQEVFPDHDHKKRSVWRTYLPHALYALLSDVVDKELEDRIDLAWKFAMCLYGDGRFNEAEFSFNEVMETRMRVLGAENPSTLTSMNNLALIYKNEGQWDKAEELGVQVMETRKRVLGVEHPYTLTSMNNLAFTWKGIGQYTEALELLSEYLTLRKKILGVNHPDAISSSATLLA